MKTIKKENWEDTLLKLSEEYCQHDKFPCLYHTFRPFIEMILKDEKQDILKDIRQTVIEDVPHIYQGRLLNLTQPPNRDNKQTKEN